MTVSKRVIYPPESEFLYEIFVSYVKTTGDAGTIYMSCRTYGICMMVYNHVLNLMMDVGFRVFDSSDNSASSELFMMNEKLVSLKCSKMESEKLCDLVTEIRNIEV